MENAAGEMIVPGEEGHPETPREDAGYTTAPEANGKQLGLFPGEEEYREKKQEVYTCESRAKEYLKSIASKTKFLSQFAKIQDGVIAMNDWELVLQNATFAHDLAKQVSENSDEVVEALSKRDRNLEWIDEYETKHGVPKPACGSPAPDAQQSLEKVEDGEEVTPEEAEAAADELLALNGYGKNALPNSEELSPL